MKNQIRDLRREQGLSQEELARRCGVSRQTINAIENNKYDPTLALAFHLAAELGVRVDELFTPDSSPRHNKKAGRNSSLFLYGLIQRFSSFSMPFLRRFRLSSLPRIAAISTPPPGVNCLPLRAMRSGHSR